MDYQRKSKKRKSASSQRMAKHTHAPDFAAHALKKNNVPLELNSSIET